MTDNEIRQKKEEYLEPKATADKHSAQEQRGISSKASSQPFIHSSSVGKYSSLLKNFQIISLSVSQRSVRLR